jgi:hypothetical protein
MERTASGKEHSVILRGGDDDGGPTNKAAVNDSDVGGSRGGEASDEQESQKDRTHQKHLISRWEPNSRVFSWRGD